MGSPEQERNKAERNRMTHRLTNVLMWRGEFLVKQPPFFATAMVAESEMCTEY